LAISSALRNLYDVHLDELPRMADFALWSNAAEAALGFKKGVFNEAYAENCELVHSIAIEGSPVTETLFKYCAERGKFPAEELPLAELLSILTAKAGESAARQKSFPKSSKGLRNEIERLTPNLRGRGIYVTFLGKTTNKGAAVALEYMPPDEDDNTEDRQPSSQTSQTSQNGGKCEDGDEGDEDFHIKSISQSSNHNVGGREYEKCQVCRRYRYSDTPCPFSDCPSNPAWVH